jgi:hypothetical protein
MLQATVQYNEPWSNNSELLKGPTTTGQISPSSIWRQKDQVLEKLGLNTSKWLEGPKHYSGQELVVLPFRYVNVAPYQLYMSEHAKGTSHPSMEESLQVATQHVFTLQVSAVSDCLRFPTASLRLFHIIHSNHTVYCQTLPFITS